MLRETFGSKTPVKQKAIGSQKGRVFTFAVFTEAVSLMPTDRLSSTLKQI
jgi:hypothetical protein